MADERMSRRDLMRRRSGGAAAAVARPRPPRRTCRPSGRRSWPGPRRRARSSSTPSRATATSARSRPSRQAYPDIKLEHTGLHSQDFAPRILQERQANLFTWDVAHDPHQHRAPGAAAGRRVGPRAAGHHAARGQGRRRLGGRLRARLRPGEGPRADLRLRRHRGGGITINTDLVKDEQIKGLTDLLESRSGRASCCCRTCA